MIVKGLCISDLHFGISCSKRLLEELSIVKDYIEKHDLDVIHINGDFFDRNLSVNEPGAILGMQFFFDIRNLCIRKKIKLRVVHGTDGHERQQTEMFKSFSSNHLDMKIFNTVTDEELFPGFRVLYMPEEYPLDANEYYKEWKTKEYNAIMGHGMWDFVAVQSVIEQGDRTNVKTCPVLKYDEWAPTIPHGMAIFGHIHARQVYKKKIYYPGSFTAWDFCDISDKGFAVYTYDTEKKYYNVNLITNQRSPKYLVKKLNKLGLDLEHLDFDELKRIVKEEASKVDFFRLEVDAVPLEAQEVLKKLFKDESNISVKFNTPKKTLEHTRTDDIYTKYDYLFNDTLKIEDNIMRYIKENMIGHDNADKITVEMIRELLDIPNAETV